MLTKKVRYLQIALNSTLDEAYSIIQSLPFSNRILIEAGTPLVKKYGSSAIEQVKSWWEQKAYQYQDAIPYVVADLKAMDRGGTEVEIAYQAGANAVTALGNAPIETIDTFIENCQKMQLDAMIDMMNVKYPWKILRQLKKLPPVVMLHRGVDEEAFNKNKPLPIYDINKIKGSSDVMVSIAGGDTPREIQSAAFNGANIIVVWKNFYNSSDQTGLLAQSFLQEIK